MSLRLFKITIKKENFGIFRQLPERIIKQLVRSVSRESQRITRVLKDTRLNNHSQYSVRRRTGALYQKTNPITTMAVGDRVIGGTVIGEGLPYTNIHVGTRDQGDSTRIVPRTAAALTIPLYPVLDNRGVRLAEFQNLRARNDLFVPGRNSPLQRGFLYQRMPGGGARKVFALRSSVVVPRRVMIDAFAEDQAPLVQERIGADVQYLLTNMRMY
jgi:hypothetical protein